MKSSVTSVFLRIIKITGIAAISLLALLFIAPYLFPNQITNSIKQLTNKNIRGELNFGKVRLSFFNHFPSLTLSLHDFVLKGSAPFEKDTLISAGKISFGINLKSLLIDKEVRVNKIFLDEAVINIEVDTNGRANYNVYDSRASASAQPSRDSSGASLRIEKIEINNSRLYYNDMSIPLFFAAQGLNYSGKGDLSKAIFDLESHIEADSFDFHFNNNAYLQHKKINANLLTRINTNSLSFLFQKNELTINNLPLQFKGKLDFLKNGYDIDVTLHSDKSDLHDFITAMPPDYVSWLKHTDVKGSAEILASCKGKYIVSENEMPDVDFDLKLRNGYVSYNKAASAASNIFANLHIQLPELDMDSLSVHIDSLYLTVDKDYLHATVHTKGFSTPYVLAKADADLDLAKLNQALGISLFKISGRFNMHAEAEGLYAKGIDPNNKSLRKKDTVLVSIPHFNVRASLDNGYFKLKSLPESLKNIRFRLHAFCPDQDYSKASLHVDSLNIEALSNYIRGSASINSVKDFPLEGNIQSKINLRDIKTFYPIDSLLLEGVLQLNLQAKGKYAPEKKLFPQTTLDIKLENGLIQTKYYPHPIEQINLTAKARDNQGNLKDLAVDIQSAAFQFEGKPFSASASLNNFDDVKYDIKAKGELDIGRIYQVFAMKGIGVNGSAKLNLSLKGRQSDVTTGRYADLSNSGTVSIHNIELSQENFPKPFFIRQGIFSFKQDKMWFDQFHASYGNSDLELDGFLSNTINYFLSKNGTLSGNFNLKSTHLYVDEFTVFAPANGKVTKTGSSNSTRPAQAGTGVVLIPANLDLSIKANTETVSYNGLELKNFTGGLVIKQGELQLQQTAFNLIGCQVNMDGKYASQSPLRALFEYHLQATDFDVHKAYTEVKLFHDLFTSAGKAEGLISIDYSLKGKLNQYMYPVYPSLEGAGVVSVRQIKLKGLKFLNEVGSKADKQDLKDPDLSKIELKSDIKNNIITIQKLKFKAAGFRIRFEGQSSFDNKINYKMRIGLPPLGIIGIPVRVTGTTDNPNIKIGKGDKNDLQETEDKDDSDTSRIENSRPAETSYVHP